MNKCRKLIRNKYCLFVFLLLHHCISFSLLAQPSDMRETIGEATLRYLMLRKEYIALDDYYRNSILAKGDIWVSTPAAHRISATLHQMRTAATGVKLIDSIGMSFISFIDCDKDKRNIEVPVNIMNKKEGLYYLASEVARLIIQDLDRNNKLLPSPLTAEAKILMDQGIAEARNGNYTSALKNFNAARTKSSSSQEIYFNLALAESKMAGHELRAMAWYGAFLSVNPYIDYSDAVKERIRRLDSHLCITINNLLGSLLVAAKAIHNKQSVGNFYSLVLLNCKQGNMQEAENICQYMQASGDESLISTLNSARKVIDNYKGIQRNEPQPVKYISEIVSVWIWNNMLEDGWSRDKDPIFLTSPVFRDLSGYIESVSKFNDPQQKFDSLNQGILNLIDARAKVLDMLKIKDAEWDGN